MATHSRILAWKISGQKSLEGYSPWGLKESDLTKHVYTLEEKKKKALIHIPST